MRKGKPAYDPARPNFKHFDGDGYSKLAISNICEFLGHFTDLGSEAAKIRLKFTDGPDRVCFRILSTKSLRSLENVITYAEDLYQDLFFQPLAIDRLSERTWFGWADTASIHPSTFTPHPFAFWETSPNQFQAVWKWERTIPIVASTSRVEAMLHEFGGKLGSHLPDSYLRVPGTPNFSAGYDKSPIVRILYDAFPQEDERLRLLFELDQVYMKT